MQPRDVVAGRFELIERAGVGGMGTVFRAEDRETGIPVAIKVLRDKRREDTQRFEREARLLSDLRHPRIVQHVAHGITAEGDPWLAMEWLSGEDLSKRLERGALRVDESVALALAVAEGLGFAHALAVIHRDLKPSNIFLVEGKIETAKILDFGIARRGGDTRMTRTGMLLGTPGYMAPEQARGHALSAQADVYSLGCVLHECLTGEPLFTGDHAVALLVKTLFDEPPRIRERSSGLPPALCNLLERMLSKEAATRPRDGAEVAEALSRLGPLPSVAASLVPAATASRALTDSEQKSVAVLLLGAAREVHPALDETLRAAGERALDETLRAAGNRAVDEAPRAEAERYGGHCEVLQDGTLSVILSGMTPVPTDLAALAARCALALRALAPGRPIVLSMGRVDGTGRLPMGQIIDRAARLLGGQPAEGGGAFASPSVNDVPAVKDAPVVLDDMVAGLLDARFDVRETAGSLVLRGERELAEGTRTLLGKATPCVGREREQRVVEQLFEACVEEGAAQVVLVTAPAGVGKSRFGQEFLSMVRERPEPTAVWIGRGDSLRAGSPLGLLGQALRGACGVREGEPLEARRDKVRAAVAGRIIEKDRARAAEFLGEILGTPFADEESPPLRAARGNAELMGDQMRAAFKDFVAGTCKKGPLIVLLEDMHWGDRATAQFLDNALKEHEEQPLFVLALARPEINDVFPDLWSKRRGQEIRLKELPKKAVERLARHVLGDKASAETIERLSRLSEGNAFYLEELLRWAAEGKSEELPQTVVAMVQARLAALDDEARRALRAASVFGESFWPGAVAALLGGVERVALVRDRLDALCERELLVKRKESRFPGEEELSFRHALLREGAYSMLTAEDLVLGHKLAGEWLEKHGEQDALLLAEHFEKGGEGEQAGRYYLRAAEQAHLASDSTAALALARRGLECGVSGDLRIALLGLICDVQYYALSFGDALPHARELLETAKPGSVPWLQAHMIHLVCALQQGRAQDFEAAVGRLMTIEASVENTYLFGTTLATTAYLLDLMGRTREAERLAMHLGACLAPFTDRVPAAALILDMATSVRVQLGNEDPARALSRLDSASALAEALGHRRASGMVFLLRQVHRWLLGAPDIESLIAGPGVLDEELALASSYRPFVLAWSLSDSDCFAEAREWANRLVTSAVTQSVPSEEGRGRWVLAEVLRRAGELDAADVEIQAALALLRLVCPLDVPGALATLAALCLAQGRPAEGVAAAEEGLELYASMGACSFYMRGAFLRLAHAECLEAAGEHEKARAAIAEARRRLLSNADKIKDPAYRASFLDNVPENRRTLELARQWLGDEA